MRRFTSFALSTVSFGALALAVASPAAAQDTATPDTSADCAVIADEAAKQACLEKVDSADPLAQEGQADTIESDVTPAATEGAGQGTIVVTGSRIRRSEFTSPDPIQIINPELGRQEGKFQTVELINSSPIAAGSTQITSAISTNFVTNGGEGAQTVSLRGLGAERTLVLLNGRRAGPAGVRGAIASFDLNTIPSSIVKSIEILKTGASSIYGSDAIAGVVNILTKQETDGIEMSGFASVPTHGGAEIYSVNATYGKDFGRGHFLISADYFHQNDLKRRDRKFLDCEEDYLKFQNGERADIFDVRTGQPACAGVLHNSFITDPANDWSFIIGSPGLVLPDDPYPNGPRPLFVLQFQQNNELEQAGCVQVNTIPGIGAPDNLFGCNFDNLSTGVLNNYSELQRAADVSSALTRKTIYADASFEVNDHIELFTELLYNNRKTKTDSVQQVSSLQFTGSSFLPSLTVTPDGFLSLDPSLPGAFCTPSDFNCQLGDAGDPFNSEIQGQFLFLPVVEWGSKSGTNVDYYRGVFGARGDFGAGFLSKFTWDVHGQYSKSDGTYFTDYARDDSLFTQDFRTRSCVGLVTPTVGLPCIDIDFTDPRVLSGNFTQEERDFLFDRDIGHTKYVQKSAEASLSGELFDLPAGPLGIAVGAHIRRDSIKDTPGEGSLLNNRFNLSSSGITAGHTLTRELFGELSIPLVRNTPFIERLELTAAGRITRVSAERRDGEKDKFGDETWKIGADWQVNDWLRFRGSWGTSFRAPALFELFLENETGFLSQQSIDLCSNRELRLDLEQITQEIFDNCELLGIPVDFGAATGGAEVASGGGIGRLKPETSTAKTASIILTPSFPFLPDTRVSLAVDYFDIEVRDEIVQLGGSNIVIGCLTSDDVLNEPLCDQITRVPEGESGEFNIVGIADPFINISEQRNRGIDVTGRITHDLGSLGKLSFLAQMTWQLEDKQDVFGAGTSDVELNGEVGDPRWVGDFNLSWEKGPWTMVYGLDVIGSADNKEDFIADQAAALNVPGTLCRTSQFYNGPIGMFTPEEVAAGARVPVCPDVSVGAVAYHSISLTRRIKDKFEFTLGMANIFDKKPPRVTNASAFGETSLLGQTPFFGSQYDLVGRRLFMQVRGRF